MDWSTRSASELYNVDGWSQGYFAVGEDGNLRVTPFGPDGGSIDMKGVVDDLVRRGLPMPLLLRFSDILRGRIDDLSRVFGEEIAKWGYKGRYRPALPIKVNQQRPVIEEIVEYGASHGLGLEVGSKPELLIAIALVDPAEGLLICNGYKDVAYVETALLAQRLGLETLLIIDRFAELETILKASKRLGVSPKIGVRAKLSSRGSGRWAESGGDRSKFGLSATEMVDVVERLEAEGMLDCLVCLHFHIGSQITAIRAVKQAMGEAVRIYADLHRMGAPLGILDVGGGLAVDYDGSKTNFHASRNYSLVEYAADIVDAIGSTLDEAEVPHPTIISESGRALLAHHSVLVVNVLGSTAVSAAPREMEAPREEEPQLVHSLWETYSNVTKRNFQEAYHDAVQLKDDALSAFRHGLITLRDRARVEDLFWATATRIHRIARTQSYVPDDLEGLEKALADIYFCNFSVFQSVPDSWAVDALFPILPIHRLDEEPTRRAILADLTCDSDGKVDQFIDLRDVKSTLELHTCEKGKPYYLGFFLVGAYQEVLGDLHNLFGDVNAVHIELDEEKGYRLKHVVNGDGVREVLSYVLYDDRNLLERLRRSTEAAIARGDMNFEESANLIRHFTAALAGYTYLDANA